MNRFRGYLVAAGFSFLVAMIITLLLFVFEEGSQLLLGNSWNGAARDFLVKTGLPVEFVYGQFNIILTFLPEWLFLILTSFCLAIFLPEPWNRRIPILVGITILLLRKLILLVSSAILSPEVSIQFPPTGIVRVLSLGTIPSALLGCFAGIYLVKSVARQK